MNDDIRSIAHNLAAVQKQAAQQALSVYTPKVDYIIDSHITDTDIIKRILDALLDVAFDEKVLTLYKKLCRYYFTIDQQATHFYIQAYRDMWDN